MARRLYWLSYRGRRRASPTRIHIEDPERARFRDYETRFGPFRETSHTTLCGLKPRGMAITVDPSYPATCKHCLTIEKKREG